MTVTVSTPVTGIAHVVLPCGGATALADGAVVEVAVAVPAVPVELERWAQCGSDQNALPDVETSVAVSPTRNSAEHWVGQSIPGGLLMTVAPFWGSTVIETPGSNLALIVRSVLIASVHGESADTCPQSPPQLVNVFPAAATGVMVALLEGSNVAVHVAAHAWSPGWIVTWPGPVTEIVSLLVAGGGLVVPPLSVLEPGVEL